MNRNNAERQAAYRRRCAVKEECNAFPVTLALEKLRAANPGADERLIQVAMEIADQGGDGAYLLRYLSPYVYAIANLRLMLEPQLSGKNFGADGGALATSATTGEVG